MFVDENGEVILTNDQARELERHGFREGYREGAEQIGKYQGKSVYFLQRHGVGILLGALGLYWLTRRRR